MKFQLIAIILLFSTCQTISANNQIVFFDADKVINQSKKGQMYKKKALALENNEPKQLSTLIKQVQSEERTFNEKSDKLNQQQRNDAIKNIQAKKNEIKTLKLARLEQQRILKIDELKPIHQALYQVIHQLAKENQYRAVINVAEQSAVVYVDSTADITELVSRRFNALDR